YFPVSIEIQLLGGLGEGERSTGNVCTPGTALVMDGKVDYRHCISSNSKTYHGDDWVSAEVVVLGGESIAHLIENDTVLKYKSPQIGGGFTRPNWGDEDWTSRGVVESKDLWIAREGEVLTQGYISLQAESHPIDFKNIQILDLCGCKDPKAKNYKSYFVKADNARCVY
ncbi:MAG: family 16 glycoside hydrolase, partial [Flavobacteriaceae bacterium]